MYPMMRKFVLNTSCCLAVMILNGSGSGFAATPRLVTPEAVTLGGLLNADSDDTRLRFLKPVFIGDTIRVKVTITEKRDHKLPGRGLVCEQREVFNQRQETVLVCTHLLLVKKRGA